MSRLQTSLDDVVRDSREEFNVRRDFFSWVADWPWPQIKTQSHLSSLWSTACLIWHGVVKILAGRARRNFPVRAERDEELTFRVFLFHWGKWLYMTSERGEYSRTPSTIAILCWVSGPSKPLKKKTPHRRRMLLRLPFIFMPQRERVTGTGSCWCYAKVNKRPFSHVARSVSHTFRRPPIIKITFWNNQISNTLFTPSPTPINLSHQSYTEIPNSITKMPKKILNLLKILLQFTTRKLTAYINKVILFEQ